MTRQDIIDYCLTYSDAYEDYPFDSVADPGAWTVMRHLSNRKSFAFIYHRDGLCVNLKSEPFKADFLRTIYKGVTPGFHMNKVHWITVRISSDVPDEEILNLIDKSFDLTSKSIKISSAK